MAPQRRSQRHGGGGGAASSAGEGSGDAVMARWLQSAGLQHLAAPLAGGGPATVGPGAGLDPRAGVLPSLLLQVSLSLQNC